jgi:hypothetical protein
VRGAHGDRWWPAIPEAIEQAIFDRLRKAAYNVDKPTMPAGDALFGARIALEVVGVFRDTRPVVDASGPVFARPLNVPEATK